MNDLVVVEKIAQWEKLKALVLDSVSSPITKRVYNMALDEFLAWFQQAPRPGFTKATVSAWRVSLEDRGLGSSSIIIRMSAIRKLAAEAADNGLLAPELAAGISPREEREIHRHPRRQLAVRCARRRALLNAPDVSDGAGACAIAPSSRFYSAAGCGDPRWRRSLSRMSSSAMAAGASSISSESTAASAQRRCRRGSRSRSMRGRPRLALQTVTCSGP